MLGNAAYAAGNCTFVVEECALIFKRGEELQDWAKPLVFMGRIQRVSLVLIAQRASKIPMDIRSQASRIITFRQTEPADVSALIDRIGEDAETIPDLPPLTCIDWEEGKVSRYSIPKPA
jgi:DNA helicase HerA-like ATPase